MAPALTEPLSPTEKLTSSAVTAAATPTTRSSRKIESIGNKSNNKSNTKANNVIKPSSQSTIREKRNRSSGVALVNQTPTSSKRLTRSRDNQHRNSPTTTSPSTNTGAKEEQDQETTPKKISKTGDQAEEGDSNTNTITTPTINNNSSSAKNEQMGLSTASLNTKNNSSKILNSNTTSLETVDNNAKDTSTAQLLADLTNEAITAEICLRNQLKDVNLVKTTGGGEPSSPIQQDTPSFVANDIVADLKAASPSAAASSDTKSSPAHMEAQSNESLKSLQVQQETTDEKQNIEKPSTSEKEEESTLVKDQQEETTEKSNIKHDGDKEHKQASSCTAATAVETEHDGDTTSIHETSIGSPDSDEADTTATAKKRTETSKAEVVCVQELPPVSTDSTMTASEAEDNLEERLSQLDGTAIDSPPPNNEIERDSIGKPNNNPVAVTTPPRTPTRQQTLSEDMQQIQQQLQHTPPTPISQQVQAQQHMQQQQQQQQNCFTPQSTTSSTNTLGSGNIPQSFIKESEGAGGGGGAELEDQDIEEVFKVLKGFEGGTTSDLNVCDLNVLFNEVYMKINESEISGNTGAGGGGGGASGAGVCITQSPVTAVNPSIQLVKPTVLEEDQLEIERRQQQMQRKTDFLLRRLRKLQARYMCKHTSEEIAGLFEWTARQASKGVTHNSTVNEPHNTGSAEAIAQDPSKYFLKVIAARPPATDWKDVQESLVPATQITTLLRKIESVANAQQLCITPSANLVNVTNKKTKKALMEAQAAAAAAAAASNHMASSSSAYAEGKAEEIVVATLEENVTEELTQVAGLLQSEMSEVQRAIDSDATESSSGGESADEMVTYNNTQQQTLPIRKRAAWRYSRDRAAIASRWSWLLSQISDLEIKIRQHSDLHQEIVRSKGLVTCGQTTENGLKVDPNAIVEQQDKEELMGSCRTRGFMPSQFRKRKLIQTTNIHTISKKAARPSTIKCGCQWPLHPCALCTGRLDPTAPRDLPDTMMMSDRIALLDSGYHPVLSFRENINNALHFEAIAKQPEWQQRVMRCQAKNIAKNVWKAEREAVAAAAGGHHSSSSKKYSEAPPSKRRYIKKKDRINNEEKTTTGGGGSTKSLNTSTATSAAAGSQPNAATTLAAASSAQLAASSSLNDTGNGTASLSTTATSTTPLVANKGMAKSAKKQHCLIVEDRIIKEPTANPLLPPPCLTAATTTTIPHNTAFIHQTSDCLPINYDQFNPSQIPSSSISSSNSNNNHSSSKSNKHRKLSSSTAVNSHSYNHHHHPTNNCNSHHLYNGDSSYMLNHDNWGGGGGAGDNFAARSRTSSPTHGISGSNYHKYERSLDRKNRTSYDIDNIVIPYSVAAATRVEILPYKEIPTPKWRVIENELEESNTLVISKNLEQQNDAETFDIKPPSTNGFICDSELLDSKQINLKTEEEEQEKSAENSLVKTECIEKASSDSKDIDLKKQEENNGDKNDVKFIEAIKENCKTSKDDEAVKDEKLTTISSSNNCDEAGQVKNEVKDIQSKKKDDDDDIKEPEPKKQKVESVIDFKSEELEEENKLLLQNNSLNSSSYEDEDISDDAMFLRHERALTEERRKFQTYLKFPWSTRSRANRRIDSRAESSGANTPDPSSPAPQTPSVGGGDQESIPSPQTPSTPLNPLDTISEAGDNTTSFLGVGPLTSLSSKHCERRRTTSTKRDRELERRSSTPDSRELIPPYESLKFPLTDEQFEELMRAMPSEHSEDSKRFDDCYLPGGGGGGIGILAKNPRTISCSSTSKRTSRASTMCGDTTSAIGGGGRRVKGTSHKHIRPISADDDMENGEMLLYEDEYDDYPKHHLAPNDDHLTADSCSASAGGGIGGSGVYDDDIYGDQYGAYVGGREQHKHRDNDGESTDEEDPFQDDDPNDPEWRGETEERFRRKL